MKILSGLFRSTKPYFRNSRCTRILSESAPPQTFPADSRFAPVSSRSYSSDLRHRNFPLNRIRNVAIIAHVDHGKTTLVDGLLQQSDTKVSGGIGDRVMDSNVLEKERGITILSKSTSVLYKDHLLNIVDTPGHADFGGEVERIMCMVDGVVLVVDATDGPMTQTKFVLGKALKKGLQPIVVVNKVDRPTSRLEDVESEILDLFFNLEANDTQLLYKTLFASAKHGWASFDVKAKGGSLTNILDTIIEQIPPPSVDPTAPFSMLVSQLDSNEYLGKLLLGRIQSGKIKVGDIIKVLSQDGKTVQTGRVLKLLARMGLNQVFIEEASAGDIISVAGFEDGTVTSTLCEGSVTTPIHADPVDPPTLSVVISANDSPLAGREGSIHTSNMIQSRLAKEMETNVALQCIFMNEKTEVRGRGELQLSILCETMRREGFELSISSPQVVLSKNEDGSTIEPTERLVIDVDSQYVGQIIEKLTSRKGDLLHYAESGEGRNKIEIVVPSRGLIGYRSEFVNDTRGSGIMNAIFEKYIPYSGPITRSQKGAILSTADGTTTTYALLSIESRGVLFVAPGTQVYTGMVIGENSRDDDLMVNPVREKQLTNMRAAGKEEFTRLTPARIMSLEELIAYVREDECIEITPKSLRLRKKILDAGARKKNRNLNSAIV